MNGDDELFPQFSVYVSLIISCLFVMYDTQLIVEKKRLGDNDFIW
jgi:FtsH-binding integral membrane protein